MRMSLVMQVFGHEPKYSGNGYSDHGCPGQIDHYKWMIIITKYFCLYFSCRLPSTDVTHFFWPGCCYHNAAVVVKEEAAHNCRR